MTRTLRMLPLLAFLALGLTVIPAARATPAPPHGATPAVAGHEAAEGGDEHAGASHAPPAGMLPGPKEGVAPAITTMIVFALVFAVLYVRVWPKITKGLEERSAKIREEIAMAEAARKQARDALDEYEKSLADARAESQKMLEDTKAQQTELAAQLRAKADIELNAMRERAKRDIESAKRTALNEIYAESVTLASTMAAKILQREISVQDQQNLVNESLAEMKAKSN